VSGSLDSREEFEVLCYNDAFVCVLGLLHMLVAYLLWIANTSFSWVPMIPDYRSGEGKILNCHSRQAVSFLQMFCAQNNKACVKRLFSLFFYFVLVMFKII